MVSVSVRYLFYQPMDEKIKTWPLRFPAKENPNMEKALFDWPIVLQYDVKAKYRLISRKYSGMKIFHPNVRLTNQNPRAFVSVPQTNQIALFSFVCCFCFVRAFSFQGQRKLALMGKGHFNEFGTEFSRLPVVPPFFLRDSRASQTQGGAFRSLYYP